MAMEKKTLGLNVWHDRAACVVEDGEVKVAIAQERLDRRKHSEDRTRLPREAIQYCCEVTGNEISDFGAIVVTSPERPIEVMPNWVEELKVYGLEHVERVHTLSHHLAHAYTAYFPSPFDEGLIWVADGGGSAIGDLREAESAYIARGLDITSVWQRHQDSGGDNPRVSLGRKYERLTYRLGFRFGQAGKTMALATFGNPERFSDKPLGSFDGNENLYLDKLTFLPEIDRFLETDPLPNFHDNSVNVRGWWADAAAHYQKFLEETQTRFIGNLMKEHHQRTLCMAGGVALNCVANSKIINNLGIENYFIQPASADDGQALGAALYGYYHVLQGTERHPLKDAYLGRKYTTDEIVSELKQRPTLSWSVHENIEEIAADQLANDQILGWFQGGSEYGPRALGHRSILANPTNPKTKEILNARVKHREMFRPFAAAVTEEEMSNYFDFSGASPFMLLAIDIKPQFREDLSSITHIDGSSRIQTVSSESELRFHRLLTLTKERLGYPILLNTSFNVAGQPIVESPADALDTFLTEDIDSLVIENIFIKKPKS